MLTPRLFFSTAVLLGLAGVLAACGPSTSGADVSDLPCVASTPGLLGPSDLPSGMVTEVAPAEVGGSFGSGFPGYVGASAAYFYWSGIPSPTAAPDGRPGAFNVPTGLAFYQQHPNQVVQIAEQVSDFGSASGAASWMSEQRRDYPPNNVADYGSGVTADPSVPALGDDAFMYQVDVGAPNSSTPFTGSFVGDVLTDYEVQEGGTVYAVAVDGAPGANGASVASSLMNQLLQRENSACGATLPTLNPGPTPTPPPSDTPQPAAGEGTSA